MTDPTLHITVGIPGCGKSTYVERMSPRYESWEILSSDDIREELTGSVDDQTANRAVFYVINKCARLLLAYGHDVVIDATNLRPNYRKDLLQIAKDCDATPWAIRFDDSEDFDLCQGRNLNRTRIVPLDIMQRFHSTFMEECSKEQLREEGWVVSSATVRINDDTRPAGGDSSTEETDSDQARS